MAIYLDDTQNEHELLIKAIENSNMKPWIKKSLIGRIQTDINEKTARTACEHSYGEYTGKKTSCTKCDGFNTNMGISWTLNLNDRENARRQYEPSFH